MSATDNAREDGIKSTRKDDGTQYRPYRFRFTKRLINWFFPAKDPINRTTAGPRA